jgi:hypothetical protein
VADEVGSDESGSACHEVSHSGREGYHGRRSLLRVSASPHTVDVAVILPRDADLVSGTVRVEIEPAMPAQRLWAFVSTTNNETQQVTIVTPR